MASLPIVTTAYNVHDRGPQTFLMAPVPLDTSIRYGPVGFVAGQAVAAAFLTFEVARSLYRSYRALGPAQDTRAQLTRRSTLLPLFAALAVLSLGSGLYGSVRYGLLSYKVWAENRGIRLSESLFGHRDVPHYHYVAHWLSTTPVHVDAAEILTEKARRFWWYQQNQLGLQAWSMLLAIEGRRRNMPLLWSYLALAQLVSLSFAQNLFFVALILTPTPLPLQDNSLPVSRYVRLQHAIFPPKPANWTLHPFLYAAVHAASFATIGLLPLFANTASMSLLVLGGRALAFAPLVLPTVAPISWGKKHTHPHEAYGMYTRLFTFISVASFLLHAKATIVGMAFNVPTEYYHRHSVLLPFDQEKREAWERTTTALGRILGAASDHPVVAAVARDVLLSALTMGIWAAVRTINVEGILASITPLVKPQVEDANENTSSTAIAIKEEDSTKKTLSKRRGVRKNPRKDHDYDEAADDETWEPSPSVAASVAEGDAIPVPDNLADLESTALTWALVAVGGLGVGTAGVVGSECIAR